jgi:hypothetical protein
MPAAVGGGQAGCMGRQFRGGRVLPLPQWVWGVLGFALFIEADGARRASDGAG